MQAKCKHSANVTVHAFADETQLHCSRDDTSAAVSFECCIAYVGQRMFANRLKLNMEKTELLRLGLTIEPLCRGTGAPFDEHRRPLAPSNFFDK